MNYKSDRFAKYKIMEILITEPEDTLRGTLAYIRQISSD